MLAASYKFHFPYEFPHGDVREWDNWTTEPYAEKGRKTIARRAAEELKTWYGGQHRDPDL